MNNSVYNNNNRCYFLNRVEPFEVLQSSVFNSQLKDDTRTSIIEVCVSFHVILLQ